MFPERDRHRLLPAGPWISSTSPARTEIFPEKGRRWQVCLHTAMKEILMS